MIQIVMQLLLRELRLGSFQICRCVESWQDCGAWAGSKRQLCVGVTVLWLAAVA